MAEARVRIKELIPTAKYANVEIEFELVGEAVELIELSKSARLKDALNKAYDDADEILQSKRDPIIAELEGGNK